LLSPRPFARPRQVRALSAAPTLIIGGAAQCCTGRGHWIASFSPHVVVVIAVVLAAIVAAFAVTAVIAAVAAFAVTAVIAAVVAFAVTAVIAAVVAPAAIMVAIFFKRAMTSVGTVAD
jgi:hypothetical protein